LILQRDIGPVRADITSGKWTSGYQFTTSRSWSPRTGSRTRSVYQSADWRPQDHRADESDWLGVISCNSSGKSHVTRSKEY
jgi:hypothetical protein